VARRKSPGYCNMSVSRGISCLALPGPLLSHRFDSFIHTNVDSSIINQLPTSLFCRIFSSLSSASAIVLKTVGSFDGSVRFDPGICTALLACPFPADSAPPRNRRHCRHRPRPRPLRPRRPRRVRRYLDRRRNLQSTHKSLHSVETLTRNALLLCCLLSPLFLLVRRY